MNLIIKRLNSSAFGTSRGSGFVTSDVWKMLYGITCVSFERVTRGGKLNRAVGSGQNGVKKYAYKLYSLKTAPFPARRRLRCKSALALAWALWLASFWLFCRRSVRYGRVFYINIAFGALMQHTYYIIFILFHFSTLSPPDFCFALRHTNGEVK